MSWLERISRLWRDRSATHTPDTAAASVSLHAGDSADCADAYFAAGRAAYLAGDYAAAIGHFNAALDVRHDHAQAHYYLGLSHLGLKSFEDAADCFLMAMHFRPDFPEALHHLGLEARRRRDYPSAVEYFERALALNPDFAHAHNNLGYMLFHDLGEHARGAAHIEAALRLLPQNMDFRANYSMVLVQRGRLEAAIAWCDELLAAHPDLHEARLNRALAALKLGRFAEAWPDYEARKHTSENNAARNFGFPEWCGESLAGKSILVYAEQGLGDQIMFASCLPDLLQRAGRSVVECSPQLEKLFRRSFPGATIFSANEAACDAGWISRAGGVDYQVAIGSLPLYFRSDLSHFPHHGGYLRTDPARRAYWRQQLDALGAGRKIGISWRGGALSTRRESRSVPLQQWLPLIAQSAAHFVSLQYGDRGEEAGRIAREHGISLQIWQQAIDDLDDTAALIAELDLVISVQTAVAHMCGALGKRAWVMVPAVAEWRYLHEGVSMPWYPSLRLFRQQRDAEWGPVIAEIAHGLAALG